MKAFVAAGLLVERRVGGGGRSANTLLPVYGLFGSRGVEVMAGGGGSSLSIVFIVSCLRGGRGGSDGLLDCGMFSNSSSNVSSKLGFGIFTLSLIGLRCRTCATLPSIDPFEHTGKCGESGFSEECVGVGNGLKEAKS